MIETRPKKIESKQLKNKYRAIIISARESLALEKKKRTFSAWQSLILQQCYIVQYVQRPGCDKISRFFKCQRVSLPEFYTEKIKNWLSQQHQFQNMWNMYISRQMRYENPDSYSRLHQSSMTELFGKTINGQLKSLGSRNSPHSRYSIWF